MSDLRDILQEIYDRRGKLTPAIVLEEAEPEDSPLHSRLTWDDEVAGHAHRINQARQLIRSVKVRYYTDNDEAKSIRLRAFHAVRGPVGNIYMPAGDVVQNPVLARILLADMERDWRQLRRRYQDFAEFWDLVRGEVRPPTSMDEAA